LVQTPKEKKKKKKELIKRRAHNLKNQGAKVQGMVQLKDSNLLQMSPNWLLGIWTLGPPM
jgi:hypothetical protein